MGSRLRHILVALSWPLGVLALFVVSLAIASTHIPGPGPSGATLRLVWCGILAGVGAMALRGCIRAHGRKRRLAANRCAACGYDLRASGDKCSECGYPTSGAAGPRPTDDWTRSDRKLGKLVVVLLTVLFGLMVNLSGNVYAILYLASTRVGRFMEAAWYAGGFDSDAWKAHPCDSMSTADGNPRSYMLNDLLNRHLLDGLTEAEVIALLGEPDFRPTEPGADFEYCVGLQRGFLPLDVLLLVLRFDENRRVYNVHLRNS